MAQSMVATKQMIEQLFDASAASYDRAGPSIFAQFGTRLAEQMLIVSGSHALRAQRSWA
jgi:hypothetical protein